MPLARQLADLRSVPHRGVGKSVFRPSWMPREPLATHNISLKSLSISPHPFLCRFCLGHSFLARAVLEHPATIAHLFNT